MSDRFAAQLEDARSTHARRCRARECADRFMPHTAPAGPTVVDLDAGMVAVTAAGWTSDDVALLAAALEETPGYVECFNWLPLDVAALEVE
jgi:hypothetical protein